jgi:hypothetical protein
MCVVYNGSCEQSKRFSYPVYSNGAMQCLSVPSPPIQHIIDSLAFLPVRAAVSLYHFPFPFHSVTECRPSSKLESAVTWEHYQCVPIHSLSESIKLGRLKLKNAIIANVYLLDSLGSSTRRQVPSTLQHYCALNASPSSAVPPKSCVSSSSPRHRMPAPHPSCLLHPCPLGHLMLC